MARLRTKQKNIKTKATPRKLLSKTTGILDNAHLTKYQRETGRHVGTETDDVKDLIINKLFRDLNSIFEAIGLKG